MKKLFNSFHQTFSIKAEALGFQKTKNGCLFGDCRYVRIINDVYQCFELDKLPNHRCTVYFGVLPLCMPISYYNGVHYRLSDFSMQREFRYDPKSDESISSCMGLLLNLALRWMFPLFMTATDCGKALNALQKLDRDKEDIRQKLLSEYGMTDGAIPFDYRTWFYEEKLYFALKTNDYFSAEKHQRAHIFLYQSHLEQNPNSAESVAEKIAQFERNIALIQNNDPRIQPYLSELERNNVEEFKKLGFVFQET